MAFDPYFGIKLYPQKLVVLFGQLHSFLKRSSSSWCQFNWWKQILITSNLKLIICPNGNYFYHRKKKYWYWRHDVVKHSFASWNEMFLNFLLYDWEDCYKCIFWGRKQPVNKAWAQKDAKNQSFYQHHQPTPLLL